MKTTSPSIRIASILPGLGLCLLVTALAYVAQVIQAGIFGRVWIESLVLAIILGVLARTAWTPSVRWDPGVRFSATFLLETAVVLLGASMSAATIAAAGPALLASVAAFVPCAIAASYGISRFFGLGRRQAVLVACGNSICGNSAIAAMAPIIHAKNEDVASSIAFTAVLGVVAVLALPPLSAALHMNELQFGAFAGLTVYAVPQVLAATAPVGAIALHAGTLVKLLRVLMLGPVCFSFSLVYSYQNRGDVGRPEPASGTGVRLRRLLAAARTFLPWFIIGFLIMIAARSLDVIPRAALPSLDECAQVLTVISMAALGLLTDLRTIGQAGHRVATAVTLSLLAIGLVSFALVRLVPLGS
jgi:uncharacterized integral membrane protein (TIGR00698 family)